MKLQLLHGPALTSSRTKLVQLKKEFDVNDVVVYEEESDIGRIKSDLMTLPLLSDERLIILENPPEDFIPTTNYPLREARQLSTTLLLWFDHEVSEKKPLMEWVKSQKGEVLFFPEAREVSVFPFLDLLAAGDKKAYLELKRLKDAGFEIQYFITMVVYLLRSLAVTPKNAPSFVKQKLEKQRKNYSLEKIKDLYREILEIDFKIKSGLLDSSQAEFLLVNKFVNYYFSITKGQE